MLKLSGEVRFPLDALVVFLFRSLRSPDSGVAEARAAQNTAILPERPPRDQALDGGLSAKPLESFPGDAAGLAIEKRRVFDGVADSTVVSSAEIPGIFAACKHAG